jgi:uncharacterized MAPEG superfamily protein
MCKRIRLGRALWLGLGLSLLLLLQPAVAQQIEIGSGVICDRGEQAERYVALFKGNAEETVTQVNAEAQSDTACSVVSVAYLRGNDVSKATNAAGTFVIARILIIGLVTADGVQTVAPFVQFTLFKIDERVA